VSLLVWTLPFDLIGMVGPADSYTTAGIALRVSESHKPRHHDKAETFLGGCHRGGDDETCRFRYNFVWSVESEPMFSRNI
jgi:hypothetical protein